MVFFRPLCSVTKQQAEKSWVTGFLWWKQLISAKSRWKVNAALLPRKYWLKANKAGAGDSQEILKMLEFDAVFCAHLWRDGRECACVFACFYTCNVYSMCPMLVSLVAILLLCMRALCMFLCIYSWSDRVNPVVCESELFIVWKPMRPAILSVTNDYLPPCTRTQTSRFSIWMARVVVLCLFYVLTRV